MTYFSTFTGVGGFEIALDKHGHTCVGMSEIDKYASAVLTHNYPNIKNYGDIKKIDWQSVPDFDILVGGSPCQDFSVAGKRKGLTGERSGLFAEFIRALQEKKPPYFIWENVKGCLSSNQGWDFAEVQTQMVEAGYQLWWQVLNAKDFGVPQHRGRIFVVGFRNGSPPEVLFERGKDQEDTRTVGKDVAYAIDANYHKGTNRIDKGRRSLVRDVRAVLTPERIHKRQNGRRMKEPGEPAFTLNSQDRHGVCVDGRVRRLTPLECERLMGWKDNWTKHGVIDGQVKEKSDTQRYKMCGNGVVPQCVEWIVRNIL